MSSCKKCNLNFKDSDLACCDNCKLWLCQTCADLTSTELRAISLKKRQITYTCEACKTSKNNCYDVPPALIENLLTKIKSELSDIVKSCLSEELLPIKTQAAEVKEEVVILRESNIQLINLLTNFGNHSQNSVPVNTRKIVPSSQVPISTSSIDNRSIEQNKNSSNITKRCLPQSASHKCSSPLQVSSPPCAPQNVQSGTSTTDQVSHTVFPTLNKTSRSEYHRQITGTNISTDLTGVEKMKFLHVNNISPGTSSDLMSSYIIQKHNLIKSDVSVKPLTSNDFYCSFKIGIRESHVMKLLKPDSWPCYVTVREFTSNPPKSRSQGKSFRKNFLSPQTITQPA